MSYLLGVSCMLCIMIMSHIILLKKGGHTVQCNSLRGGHYSLVNNVLGGQNPLVNNVRGDKNP